MADDDNDLAAMGYLFRARSKIKRASNREDSPKLLDEAGVTYTVHNLGAHLIVDGPECVVDFWPGTGKWIVRAGGPTGRGVLPLLKFLKG
jgi:hypothetical protein